MPPRYPMASAGLAESVGPFISKLGECMAFLSDKPSPAFERLFDLALNEPDDSAVRHAL